MPTLKHLTCSLEWMGSKTSLREYRTAYSDGRVETFVAIPSIPTPFSVRLRSHGYIAPGLAMFVYMDGVYQCNRNRRSLKIPDGTTPRKNTEINFNVRQKEDMLADGTFTAKEWRFEKVKTASGDAPKLDHEAPHGAEYVGMIEVVVLRCHPVSAHPDAGTAHVPHLRSSKVPTGSMLVGKNLKVVPSLPLSDDSSESSETSGPFIGMFDGAGDEAPHEGIVMSFGGDAAWDEFLPKTSKASQKAGALSSSPAASDFTPFNETSGSGSAAGSVLKSQWHGRNQSRFHFEQDWSQSGRPSSQITQSRNSPQTQAQGKSGGAAETAAANASVSGRELSAPGNTVPGEPGRPSPTVQGTHAVIVDTDQEDSTAGPWVFRPVGSAVSDADSWVTRPSRREYGEERRQASNEPEETRRSNTSWQVPATWSESDRGGQPPDDKQDIAKGSATNKPQVNLLIRSDSSNMGNKDSKALFSNTVNSGPAGGGWTVKPTGANPDPNDIRESKNRDSWDSISPTGAMPGAWYTNDKKNVNNTAGWSTNAVPVGEQIQSPSGEGNEICNVATKKSDIAKHPAVVDSSKLHRDGKKEATPSDLRIDAKPDTQSWSWSKPKKIAISSNQPEDRAGLSGLEVKVSPRSETHVSKPPASGGTAQSTRWGLPSSEGQGRPSFFEKVRSRLGSPSLPKNATSFAEHDKNKSEMPGFRTRSGSRSFTAADLNSPIVPSQPPLQKHAGSDKHRPQQVSVVGPRSSHLTAAEIYRKPYWSTKSKVSARPLSTTGDGHSDASPGPESSLYAIPEEVAQRNHVSHQVQRGKPVVYAHKTAKPKYMDSHESPYAVFVFNYRSEDAIREMLSIEVIEDEDEEKRRLLSLSKAELIEHFMRAKAKEPDSQPGAAGAWQKSSGLESVAGGASVTSPKGLNGLEARTTTDNNSSSNAGVGIDLNGLTKGFANLQTSPKNASDAGSPNPNTLWGRKEQNPGWSNTEAEGWNLKSSNENNSGGNWRTSSSNNGNDQGSGGGGAAGSPLAQRNDLSTAGNKWSGSVAHEQKSNGSDWKPGNSNAENNWGGGSNNKSNENENSNAGNNRGSGSNKKDNKNEDSNAGYNWGGESPSSQGQNNKRNASANDWGGSGGATNTPGAGGSGSGEGWAEGRGQSNSWVGDGGAKGGWAGGGGGSGWGGGDGKGGGGNGNKWSGDGGTKGGWAGGGGGTGWGGDDGKGSGGNGNTWGGSGQNTEGGDDGKGSGGNGNNWGGSGQNGQGGDTQW